MVICIEFNESAANKEQQYQRPTGIGLLMIKNYFHLTSNVNAYLWFTREAAAGDGETYFPRFGRNAQTAVEGFR
jgi:hypothetical protein